jgi:hypothetical protein
VLRISGTKNYKNPDQPTSVEIYYDDGRVFTYEEQRKNLELYLPQLTTSKAMPFITDMKERSLQLSKLATGDDWDDLGAGVEQRKAAPRDIDQVKLACAHVANALETGGAGYSYLLWYLDIQIAHYCTDRGETARRLSKGYHPYEPTETDEKLTEVEKDRLANPRYGFPRCETIQSAGAKECAGCPHRKLNKSPLNVPGALAPQAGIIPDIVDQDGKHQPIPGGVYELNAENLNRINERYTMVIDGPDTYWIENMGPEGYIARQEEDLQLQLINAYFQKHVFNDGKLDKTNKIKFYTGMAEHPGRDAPRHVVFKPNQPRFPAPGEFNMWEGWGVVPNFDFMIDDGRGGKRPRFKLRRILNHAYEVLCSRNKDHYKYFLEWYGWLIQNLGQPPQTSIVTKDDVRGSGKSCWTALIKRLLGKHAHVFTNKEQLFSKHAVFPYLCLAILDDVVVERDSKAQDMIKGLITGETRIVEPKFKAAREIPQRTAYNITTNHNNPILAGVNERRLFVPKINASYAQDPTYFDPLFDAINTGGAEMLLGFFLRYPLGKAFHPQQVPKTAGLAEMQIMNINRVHRWLFDCTQSGYLLGCDIFTRSETDEKTKTVTQKNPRPNRK